MCSQQQLITQQFGPPSLSDPDKSHMLKCKVLVSTDFRPSISLLFYGWRVYVCVLIVCQVLESAFINRGRL